MGEALRCGQAAAVDNDHQRLLNSNATLRGLRGISPPSHNAEFSLHNVFRLSVCQSKAAARTPRAGLSALFCCKICAVTILFTQLQSKRFLSVSAMTWFTSKTCIKVYPLLRNSAGKAQL